ncbi:MAG: TonB family protein [Chitinophagaceae bacterium]|nr:TonB family protein [Chitinophagaceae bacterium]
MKPELILQADILDIIFENRNKEYGAYNLRKEYDARMKKAMLGVLLLAAGIFLMNYWNQSGNKFNSSGSVIVIDSVVIAPPPVTKPPAPVEPPKQKIPIIRNPTFVITSDPVTDTIPTVQELDHDVLIGSKTQTGEPAISDVPAPEVQGTGTEKVPVETPKDKSEILVVAEIMPEFPGGQAAFIRFLSKNLRVPDNALEPGQKIKILVRFVVGREGELTNIQFIETNGEVFEQEVLRVMRKMPKWKPGRQNGENVQVYFKLPIVFDVPEE